MGDRVSIQFVNGKDQSVVLFNHWGGTEFPERAYQYVQDLQKYLKKNYNPHFSDPLSRLEPNTIMVDFIRDITRKTDRVNSSLYLAKDEYDGDNSDNGHWLIDLKNIKLIAPDNYENNQGDEN